MAGGSPYPMRRVGAEKVARAAAATRRPRRYNGAEYTETEHAKQGALGSYVLRPRETGATWTAGAVVNVSWYIAFNHGGGYKYRVCPRASQLTEACFQRPEHALEFASTEHVVLFADGARRVPNRVVAEGLGGLGWMVNPIPMPNFVGSDCDDMDGKPSGGCPCGSGYPGGARTEDFPNPFGEDLKGKNTAIVDEVRVPAALPPGEYVVGFRWDCETSSQVWSSCADVPVVA